MLRLIFAFLTFIPFGAVAEETSVEGRALSPIYAPLLAPVSAVVPGSSHFIRGDSGTGLKLLKAAGISLGTFIAFGGLTGLSGAAYALMVPSVPILLVSGSAFMAAGSADFIGAFSRPLETLAAPSLVARNRSSASMSYLYVPNRFFDSNHYYRIGTELNLSENLLSASVVADARARNVFYEGAVAVPLLTWADETQSARLYLEIGGLHERNPDALYNASRLQTLLLARLPLSLFGPTLRSAFLELSAGYQYRWTHYAILLEAPSDYQSGVAGGFEIGWQMSDRAHTSWGYEHARDGLIGGVFTGHLGHFHVGGGVRVTPSGWLTTRLYAGKPVSYSVGWESTF